MIIDGTVEASNDEPDGMKWYYVENSLILK